MKRFTLLMSMLITFCFSAFSQSGWYQVNSGLPNEKGIGQMSVAMNNNMVIWGLPINADGSIYDAFTKSIDGGLSWEAGSFNAGNGLSQLFAIDATTCWAVFNTGSNQGLYKTVDGGLTWVKKGTAYGSGSFANVIHFFDEMNGFAEGDPLGDYYELYTTTDGGESWTRVPEANIPAPTSGEYGITGNYCAYGDNIWFGTNQGRIFRSTDKGYTWDVSLTAFGETETVGSFMFDELNGIAYRSYLDIGVEPLLNETTDGGVTWTEFSTTGAAFGRYFSQIPGTENTIIGSAMDADAGMGISISEDGGHNWTEITSGYPFMASVWQDVETGCAGTFTAGNPSTGGVYVKGTPVLPPPANLQATVDILDVYLTWDAPASSGFSDDFESYEDFAIDFAPWTNLDVDGSTTYGMTDILWPNAYEAQSFIIFNPSMTTPAVTDIIPHSGDKLAACFAATAPPNNDWLITPEVYIADGFMLKFWAKSYTDEYGLERFKVGVSTTGLNPTDFTIISAGSYVEAPVEDWSEFTYDLSAYAGQNVYVGIQCVSNDAFILLVDDVTIGATKSPIVYNPSQPVVGKGTKNISYTHKPAAQPATKVQSSRNINSELMGYNVYRDGVKLNTAIVETQEYTDTDLPVNTFEYYVTAVYDAGESDPSNTVVIVITDFADISADNDILVYPNPASDYLIIKAENIMQIRVLNSLGQVVIDNVIGSDNTNIDISDLKSGIYFIHLDTQKGSVTRKVIVK